MTDLAAHIKGIVKLTDDSRADLNHDTKVDVKDLMALAAHIKGISKLS